MKSRPCVENFFLAYLLDSWLDIHKLFSIWHPHLFLIIVQRLMSPMLYIKRKTSQPREQASRVVYLCKQLTCLTFNKGHLALLRWSNLRLCLQYLSLSHVNGTINITYIFQGQNLVDHTAYKMLSIILSLYSQKDSLL